jgi:hypothetical protein
MKVLRFAALAAALGQAALAGPVLQLFPKNGAEVPGNILTGKNETVGWGFSLTNDTLWMVPTAVQLLGDPFPVGTGSSFHDLLGPWFMFNGTAVGPGENLTQSWSPGATGFAEFDFPDSPFSMISAPLQLELDYDVFDADPSLGGNWVSSTSLTVDAQFQVPNPPTPPAPPSVPEPGTAALLLPVAAAFVFLRKRR